MLHYTTTLLQRELQKPFLSCKLSRSFGGTCHTPAFITLDKKKLHLFHIKILCMCILYKFLAQITKVLIVLEIKFKLRMRPYQA